MNTLIGRKVKIVGYNNSKYHDQIGTIIDDHSEQEHIWKVKMPDEFVLRPWGNTHPNKDYWQAELLPQEKPETFYITSEYPEIMKVFWEEMKKVRYTSTVETHRDLDWKEISANSRVSETGKGNMDMYISCKLTPAHKRDKQFTIPQQWTEALQYITDAAKYWEEQEKEPEYKIGDYVYLKSNLPNSYYGKENSVGTIGKITRMNYPLIKGNSICVEHPKGTRNWYYEDIRSATPEEIQKAKEFQKVEIPIGANKQLITVANGKITTENKYEIGISTVKTIIDAMKEIQEVSLLWPIIPSIDIAPNCSSGVKGITLVELQSIVDKYNKLTKA